MTAFIEYAAGGSRPCTRSGESEQKVSREWQTVAIQMMARMKQSYTVSVTVERLSGGGMDREECDCW